MGHRAGVLAARVLDAVYLPLAEPDDDDLRRLRKTLVMLAGIGGSVMTLNSAFLVGLLGAPRQVVVLLVAYAVSIAVSIAFVVVARRGYDVVIVMLLASNLIISAAVTWAAGGLEASGANVMWGIVAPLIALMIYPRRRAALWFVAFLVVLVPTIVFSSGTAPDDLSRVAILGQFAVNLAGISLFVFLILMYFIVQRDKAQRQVEHERARSDLLLRNVLPDAIAERLKDDPALIADDFADASVLFADIADFTPMSAGLEPADLVSLLNDAFSEFDRLVTRYGVEKIKTIGDCYMVASGVPEPRADHAQALADLAIEILAVAERRVFDGHRLRFRIGINSGPLVAGVIGEQRFIYDLWGDTVNVASRMESHGLPGRIHITEATRARLGDGYRFTDRGVVEVKGRGAMRTFLLDGHSVESTPGGA